MSFSFDVAVFDLDGVVTFTAGMHEAAWKELFDEYLRHRQQQHGAEFRAFRSSDYRTYVDGRLRADGIRTFLAARGIVLPEGTPSDPPEAETVAGLGRRKNRLFLERLRRNGVPVDEATIDFIQSLREHGIRIGAASSSRNAALILESAGIEDLFDARVDGVLLQERGLPGKPAPDLFLACLELLGQPPSSRAMVAEDATVGVEAARAGGFGLVVGVDRGGQAMALREHGADWVISDFRGMSFEAVEAWFANRRYA